MDFISKHRTGFETGFDKGAIVAIEIQALAMLGDAASAKLLLSNNRSILSAETFARLEAEVARAEGSDPISEYKRAYETTRSADALRALVGVLVQKNEHRAAARYGEELFGLTYDPRDIAIAAKAYANAGEDDHFIRIVQQFPFVKSDDPAIAERYAWQLCATTARRGGSDVTEANFKQPCCTRDEGWPLGLGLQDQGPNHRKLRRHNGRGGERCGKGGITRQVCAGKTNASEPLMTCRKRCNVAETRLQLLAWDEARREPADWPSGDRHEDGVRPARGSCAERGSLAPRCQGRPPSGRTVRSRVPMRGAGTDGFVVAKKLGNAGGAKGPDTLAEGARQPERGGAGV